MCGLTGFARHPDGAELHRVLGIFNALLLKTEARGHHATGVAAVGGSNPFLLKRAVEASKFMESPIYREAIQQVTGDTPVLIGHTRHATHQNAHLDEAAHPFHIGHVIGAHNGIIYNWRGLWERFKGKGKNERLIDTREPWINDSQAPFALLNLMKDPIKATDELDGWWALTWTKGETLYMSRTNGVPLSAAYVPSMRALFWNSQMDVLTAQLQGHGLAAGRDFSAWELKTNTIYEYLPTMFTQDGTNGVRTDAPFRGITGTATRKPINSARPNEPARTPTTGYSTRTYPDGSKWNPVNATVHQSPRLTIDEINDSIASLKSQVRALTGKVRDLTDRVAVQDAEIEHLYGVINETRPEMFDLREDEGTDDDATGDVGARAVARVQARMVAQDAAQLALPSITEASGRCDECGQGGGEMLRTPGGGWVHPRCVLVE
jgi:uncharacterized coiled-coil protein SlyX